jgi:hypothetical protein
MKSTDKHLTVIHRAVRHARLRVTEDAYVELVVPLDFSQEQVRLLLDKKDQWIEGNRAFFLGSERNVLGDDSDAITLFGEQLNFEWIPQLGRRVVLKESEKTIAAGRDLLNASTREHWLRDFARSYLRERVDHLSTLHSLRYRRLFIRSQKTRWGSCSAHKNISLNWQLIRAPREVIDYVILHELIHTKLANHTHRFWVHLKSVCPRAESAREWLRSHVPR